MTQVRLKKQQKSLRQFARFEKHSSVFELRNFHTKNHDNPVKTYFVLLKIVFSKKFRFFTI